MDEPSQVPAKLVTALRRLTGMRIVDCKRYLQSIAESDRETTVEMIARGEIRVGSPPDVRFRR
jgi:translation elongation factor EF-Ts